MKFGSFAWELICVGFCLLTVQHSVAQFNMMTHPVKLSLQYGGKLEAGDGFRVVVHIDMPEGWHTYWLNPGDSGMPPAFTWDLPDGIQEGRRRWLPPQRIVEPPLVTLGYENDAWIIQEFLLHSDADVASAFLRLETSWLICKDVCIPRQGQAELSLAALPENFTPENHLPEHLLPFLQDPDWLPGVSATRVGREIKLVVDLPNDVMPRDFFPLARGEFEIMKPVSWAQQGNQWHGALTLTAAGARRQPDRLGGLLYLSQLDQPVILELDEPLQ